MTCRTCGAVNEDGASYCEKCKADMEMPSAISPSPVLSVMDDSVTVSESAEAFSRYDSPIPLLPLDLESTQDIVPLMDLGLVAPADVKAVHPESTADLPALTDTQPQKPKTAVVSPPMATTPTFGSPKLVVVRGQRMDVQYPLFAGKNYLGRTDDKPVDIDLDDQEAPDRIWTSRQHAVITFENGELAIEDLSSLNGTFVNRTRVHPGQVRELHENDVIQVGTVHMKVLAG
jgi:hypothetical protein